MNLSDKSEYTFEFRILASTWYHESDRTLSAMRVLIQRLDERFKVDNVPDGRVIKQWHEKLFTTGNLFDLTRCGRPRNERHDAVIADSVEAAPELSLRRRSAELNVAKSTILDNLKRQGYRAWKPTFTQFLSDEDKAGRVQSCVELANGLSPEEKQQVIFSDECAVYGDGKNKNLVIWSKENPHFHKQVQQHPPTVMIWGAISHHHIIGPFFCEGNVTAANYCRLLSEQLFPALRDLGVMETCYLQQDGAPAHTA